MPTNAAKTTSRLFQSLTGRVLIVDDELPNRLYLRKLLEARGCEVSDAASGDLALAMAVKSQPDLILTHRGRDRHQDHRLVSELTWNTFRRHLILEYEIPKYDGDLESPNVFFAVPDDLRERKVELLMKHFSTQRSKTWFTPATFDGLMRLRGIESAVPSGYAEGFHGRKLVLGNP